MNSSRSTDWTASCTPPVEFSAVSIPKTWTADNTQFDSRTYVRPLAKADVYVDDFLLVAQTKRAQTRLLRHALTSIDQVLWPLEVGNPVHRKEPTSVKKLLQGDAHWITQKRMLGWDLDTVVGTLTLPPHRLERLQVYLDRVQPPCTQMATMEWHQILGELRSMSAGLPGSRGLFSVLQAALIHGDKHRVCLNQHFFNATSDFRFFVASLASRPTRMRELVPAFPSDTGSCDACRIGNGGVWFDGLNPSLPPMVWRSAFLIAVQRALITSECPRDTISISDLELSSTSTSDRAYLLRLNSLHQRAHRYVA